MNTKILRGVEFLEIKEDLNKNFLLLFGPKSENCAVQHNENFEGGDFLRGMGLKNINLKIGILLRGGIFRKLHLLLVLCSSRGCF